jgi:hypothetical protein
MMLTKQSCVASTAGLYEKPCGRLRRRGRQPRRSEDGPISLSPQGNHRIDSHRAPRREERRALGYEQ